MQRDPLLVITSEGSGQFQLLRELWGYRHLLWYLCWKDILVRYRQTVVGIGWSVLRPVLMMAIFTMVFGRLANLPADGGAPYPILVYSALLAWQYFATAVSDGCQSLIGNAHLVSKIYFPRIIMPTAAVIVNLVDFAISFGVLLLLMAWYGFVPEWNLLLVPLLLLWLTLLILGVSYLLSAVNVRYRDFRYIVTFMIQIGYFISPLGFSSGVVPEEWRLIYSLNPLVGVVDSFRWAIIGSEAFVHPPAVVISLGFTVVIFYLGLTHFLRVEREMADHI